MVAGEPIDNQRTKEYSAQINTNKLKNWGSGHIPSNMQLRKISHATK